MRRQFQVSRAEAALAGSIMTGLTLAVGPPVSSLIKRFGHRRTSLAGSLLATFGLLLAGLYIDLLSGDQIAVLYVTIGILSGLGFGLLCLPAIDILQFHFNARLGLALGLASSGSGLGQLVLAPLLQLALSSLGLGSSFYCLAVLVALTIPAGLLYKTPEGLEKVEEDEEKQSAWQTYKELLSSPPMILLLFSHLLVNLGIFSNFSFMADHAVQHGMDINNTGLLLSVMGGANCAGRIIFGFLLDRFRQHALLLTAAILITNAISFLLGEFLRTFGGQAALAGTFGLTFGAYSSSTVIVLRTITKDTTTALGLCFLAFATSSLLGSTTAGAMFDSTGDYCLGLLVMAILAGVGSLLLGPILWIQKKAERKHLIG